MVRLRCINLERRMTESGHNPNCRPPALCQLWPAADITPNPASSAPCQELTHALQQKVTCSITSSVAADKYLRLHNQSHPFREKGCPGDGQVDIIRTRRLGTSKPLVRVSGPSLPGGGKGASDFFTHDNWENSRLLELRSGALRTGAEIASIPNAAAAALKGFSEARRQRRKKLQHLTAAKLFPDDDLLGRINAVDLKHVLGDIQTDCGNLHVDGSLCGL